MSKERNTAIARIAREALGIETLEARNGRHGCFTSVMDSLDFHDLAVWSIKEALERAYEAGRNHHASQC